VAVTAGYSYIRFKTEINEHQRSGEIHPRSIITAKLVHRGFLPRIHNSKSYFSKEEHI